jgi:glycosyltransferase involved in cell wall biosynthesis
VLSRLDAALAQAGQRSLVIAAEGSSPAGELIAVPQPTGEIDDEAKASVQAAVARLVAQAVERERPDIVHLHGIDFDRYLPADGPPALVTLHMPLAWYAEGALAISRPNTWLVPVSDDQVRRGPPASRLMPPVTNGVDVEAFQPRRKRGFVLALGRICPEKGFHLALDAAKAAGAPLLLAGAVFPYADHRRYFQEEIRPRLDRIRRWIGPVAGRAKRRLMSSASCVIAPSLAPETSSLVAREALAAGTPVVALRNGALAEAVDSGTTGILVDDPADLPDAIRSAEKLDSETCRAVARERFSDQRMIGEYFAIYRRLAEQPVTAG